MRIRKVYTIANMGIALETNVVRTRLTHWTS